jgi:hypothetical protein
MTDSYKPVVKPGSNTPAVKPASPVRVPKPHGAPVLKSDAARARFLEQAAAHDKAAELLPGRIIMAMDATASREASWEMACRLQRHMFEAVEKIGGLQVQLCWFKGKGKFGFTNGFLSSSAALAGVMHKVQCEGGFTQIRKVLMHARKMHLDRPIKALVYVGDSMEEDEPALVASARELTGVPCFMFHEGLPVAPGEYGDKPLFDEAVENPYRRIAEVTGGVYARFDAGSADQLRDLLSAFARFSAGGVSALASVPGAGEPTSSARPPDMIRTSKSLN